MKIYAGNYFAVILSCLLTALLLMSCGGSGSPTAPGTTDPGITGVRTSNASSSRMLWGVYQIEINPDTLEAEIEPLRSAEFNANVTKFLQPPSSPINMLTVYIDQAASDIPGGLIVLDVTIKHPFVGYPKFRGFDVRGIFMANASQIAGFDPTLEYANWPAALPGTPTTEPVLLNADGYTRWWNPTEFSDYGLIFGYTQGHLAPNTFYAGATLNPYKYFCDGLEAQDPLNIDPASRGTFGLTPGFNKRRYEIQFAGTPWLYNYAVDASWALPDPSGEPDFAVESFPPAANCQEPYRIALSDTESTAFYINDTAKGGEFVIDIEIFDWQVDSSVSPSAVLEEISSLWVESPAFIDAGSGNNYFDIMAGGYDFLPGSNNTSATIRAHIPPDFSPSGIAHAGEYPIMIAAESFAPDTYEPQIDGGGTQFTYPDATLAAYGYGFLTVTDLSPQDAPIVLSVVPDEGAVDNILNDVEIHGENFMDGMTVEFRHVDDTFAMGPFVGGFIDDALVLVDLDLTGAPLGFYDIFVVNPDLQSGEGEALFEVTEDLVPTLVFDLYNKFDPNFAGYNMYTPAIIVENDGDICFAYEEWFYDGSSNTSYASAFASHDDGATWPEWAWSFVSWGWHHHADVVKIWPSSTDISYRTLNLIDPDETEYATGFFATTMPGPNDGEYAHISHSIFHANEILQDSEGYAYAIGDYAGSIQFKRSETPDCIDCGPSGSVWQAYPIYQIVNPGTLSRVRSSALYNGIMQLVYFEESGNVIRLAYQSGTFTDWNTDTTIWNGAGSDYDYCRDPGLQLDDTGYHVTFIRENTGSGVNELCYTYSSDGTVWTEPSVIRVSDTKILDAPIISYDWDGTPTLGTVWQENNMIWASFSIDAAASWEEPILVSETFDDNRMCDLAIAPTGNWHFIWSALDPTAGLRAIEYRRAHMEWQ